MTVELWTDGACSGNPGPGGWAYVLAYPDGSRREGSGGDPATTNNRMEMRAAIEGLRSLGDRTSVVVMTDSAYVADPFVKGWIVGWENRGWVRIVRRKRVELKNADLWRELRFVTRRHEVAWRRVQGHVGIELNERCDALAVAAIPGRPYL